VDIAQSFLRPADYQVAEPVGVEVTRLQRPSPPLAVLCDAVDAWSVLRPQPRLIPPVGDSPVGEP
jgi:hypothetical protein